MIRPAEKNDANEILVLQKAAFHEHIELYQNIDLPMFTETIDEFLEFLKDYHIVKYLSSDNRIIGSVRWRVDKGICALSRLIVAPEYQGNGIGALLLKYVENQLPSGTRVELFTGSKSSGNIRFYLRHGYQIFKTVNVNHLYHLCYFEKRI